MKNRSNFLYLGFVRKVLLLFLCLFGSSFFFINNISAASGTYDKYDVNIVLNEDSTMDVTETVTTTWTGEFHYINRDLTLSNSSNLAKCKQNSSLQCGGFGYASLIGVYDGNGNKAPDSQVDSSITNDGSSDYLSVKWTFSSRGQEFNNEQFKYSIKYKVYGSLGYFDKYDLFYWNALPSSRPATIASSTITINYPKSINFTKDNLKVFASGTYTYQFFDKSIILNAKYIPASSDFTILYSFPKNIIQEYASLNIESTPTPIDVTINGVLVQGVSGSLTGLVPGENKLVFSKEGYNQKEISSTLTPGEIKDISITLDEALITKIIRVLNIIGTCCGILILPIGCFLIYRKWKSTGRDKGVKRTIIPEYSPPDGLSSYLVGSLKDEKVDLIDITSSIIDLAFRGFLKIREYTTGKILGLGGTKEYEFTKIKESEGLTEAEKDILDGIFNEKDVVTLTDLKYKFYKNIPTIKDDVYKEMMSKGFFTADPEKTRSKYMGFGVGLLTLSFLMFFLIGPLFFIIGIVASIGFSAFVLGIILMIVSNYMPAKSEHGRQTFEKVMGFRMYMYTAERFRVQDLTPETFEKYLSYAICFQIETKWAERFKDIYKTAPDWFETENMNTFTTLYFINSLTSFHTVAASALTTSYSNSSSGSGSGWSGGGGFSGGFSGGGGGGGGSGWG